MIRRLINAIADDVGAFNWRYILALLLTAVLPVAVGNRLRAYLYRWLGFRIGRGCVFLGAPKIHGSVNAHRLLRIGERCVLNTGVLFDLGAEIALGNDVGVGHEVMFLTHTHALGDAHRRCGPMQSRPIEVGDGAWIGSRAIILPGVRVGRGVVVGAGATVVRDIPDNAMVAAHPARMVRRLEPLEAAIETESSRQEKSF